MGAGKNIDKPKWSNYSQLAIDLLPVIPRLSAFGHIDLR
jgi:hypothetical protein